MSSTATRLITLIMLLQSRPNRKASELAEKLGVSVRTLHRYIAMLDEMGIPIYSERGPHGGFSLVRGYHMPPLVFTPEEAVAIHLGTSLVGEMWGKLYRDAAGGALAKLDNVLPDEQRHEVAWARRTLVATHMHRASLDTLAPFLEKLRRAIRERRRATMTYRSRGRPEPLARDVDFYALVHRWGWWYSIGHCHLREAMRSFRVDRIVDLTLLDEIFDVPADFDIHEYLAVEMKTRPTVGVRMRFLGEAASLVWEDRGYWDTIDEQPDGSIIVSAAAPDLEWAVSMAMIYGPNAVVLEPDELRRLIALRAGAIAAQYDLMERRQTMSDTLLAAPCGLYCGNCSDLLLDKVCHGCGCDCGQCAAGPHHAACAIYRCCVGEKGLASCAECGDFPCTRIIQFAYDPIWRTHLPVLENLRRMQRIGLEAWVDEQAAYWADQAGLDRWLRLHRECGAKYAEVYG